MDRIAVIGGGGHATVILDLLRLSGSYAIAGCIDKAADNRLSAMGVPYLGTDETLDRLQGMGITRAVMGVAGLDNAFRHRLFQRALSTGLDFPVLVHPGATVAHGCRLGVGTVVMAGAILNPGACLGQNVIVNTAAVVEHDCAIGNSVQLAPGSLVCGGVTVGDLAYVGARACVIQRLCVGEMSFVAAGAVVLTDVPDRQRVAGIPARPIPQPAVRRDSE